MPYFVVCFVIFSSINLAIALSKFKTYGVVISIINIGSKG